MAEHPHAAYVLVRAACAASAATSALMAYVAFDIWNIKRRIEPVSPLWFLIPSPALLLFASFLACVAWTGKVAP